MTETYICHAHGYMSYEHPCPLCQGQKSTPAIPSMGGRKDDAGKLRFDLEDQSARCGLVEILTYGATKYEPRNWEKGMDWGRVYAALQRHLAAWWGGEELDAGSKLHHLDHAACCLHFLQAYTKRQIGKDDRPR